MDPWGDDGAIPRVVELFRPLGFTEFVFYPPRADQLTDFSRVATKVLPTLRG